MRAILRRLPLLVLVLAAMRGAGRRTYGGGGRGGVCDARGGAPASLPRCDRHQPERVRLTPALRGEITAAHRPHAPQPVGADVPVYVAMKEKEIVGYAVVVNEIGKHRPITFVVGVEAGGKVRGVEIMVYRESVGSDVRTHRFLKQYRGKTLDAPFRSGRDITNISGATLSVRAVNRGTRKALALVEILYGTPGNRAAERPARSQEGDKAG